MVKDQFTVYTLFILKMFKNLLQVDPDFSKQIKKKLHKITKPT